MVQTEIPTTHWADHTAEELLEKHPQKETLVCASGISPSGYVHIGNFREVITVDLVVRALRDRGKKVRFLYSWDDYDALRKIPKNLPHPEKIELHLRKPYCAVPDPYGKAPSWAAYFEGCFEKDLEPVGIRPDFIRQNEKYRAGVYAKQIRFALENETKLAEILNRWRTEPLPKQWKCVTVYCKECGRDTTEIASFTPPDQIAYRCKPCKKDFTVNFETEPGVKLLWRIDWPMRWKFEGVDFEPGGKDHSSPGGSYESGAAIIREIWQGEPPHYLQYDFVILKGLGAKLSSSSGELITLREALDVYEPAVLRWLFASRKPNIDFSIAFDLDVLRAYDDFDRMERVAFGVEEAAEKKLHYEKRIYELSCVAPPKLDRPMPVQFPFRHLCNLLQIFQGDMGQTEKALGSLSTEDRARFQSRAARAWNWIQTHAPEDFRFSLREGEVPATSQPQALKQLIAYMENNPSFSESEITQALYTIISDCNLKPRDFYSAVYETLIGKTNGPKLASFLVILGAQKTLPLFRQAVTNIGS